MSRKLTSAALVLALTAAGPAVAQSDPLGAGSGTATSSSAAPDPGQTTPTDRSPAGEPMTPNAPPHAAPNKGPRPAGNEAGTTVASRWSPSPTTIAAIGAAAIGAVVCLAICGGGGGNTTTTTTTAPK
ncbi:MAG: hypothetical protein ACREHV_12370 [Rhizomicrobium sp.]